MYFYSLVIFELTISIEHRVEAQHRFCWTVLFHVKANIKYGSWSLTWSNIKSMQNAELDYKDVCYTYFAFRVVIVIISEYPYDSIVCTHVNSTTIRNAPRPDTLDGAQLGVVHRYHHLRSINKGKDNKCNVYH